MTEQELKKEKKKESNKKYQDKLKANLSLLKTEKNGLRWSQIESFLLTPQAIFWLTITFVFTSFLVWQGSVFLKNYGESLSSSILFSLVGEGVFLCSAVFMFVGKSRFEKLFSGFIFMSSLLSLVFFLHGGSTSSINKNTPAYTSTKKILEGLRSDLSNLRLERKKLPDNRITKKFEMQNKIDIKVAQEIELNKKLLSLELESIGLADVYLSIVRIAVLLLNLLLVHKIIQSFAQYNVQKTPRFSKFLDQQTYA